MLCDYGCGETANYKTSNGKNCCSKRYNSCPAIRAKNSAGTKQAYTNGVKTFVFTDEHRLKSKETQRKRSVIHCLRENSPASNHMVKKRLTELGVAQHCSECGISEWRGKLIPLELDHINGKNTDNRIENLRLLCPNCHSLTDTWRGKNINSGKIKVTDKEILTAYEKCSNIRQTLIEVGLAPKGGNYKRVTKLITALSSAG